MRYYTRVCAAVNTVLPSLRSTHATNLALLIRAILLKRTLCLSERARAYPSPVQRRIPAPNHDLLHRLKRLWRFLNHERLDPRAVQLALVPHTIARLGYPHWLGLAIDWTMFDTIMPSGRRVRYHVLRMALPRRGRAIPYCNWPTIVTPCPPPKVKTNLKKRHCSPWLRRYPPVFVR